jgi:DNA-binding NarL/FixJ family response regulator
LVVDDHFLSRQGIVSILGRLPSLQVVGEASGVQEAVEKARELSPDLILMDIRLPDGSGIEATRTIKSFLPRAKVVILSVSDDVQDFFEAIKAGAQGYLVKNMEPETWLEYLENVVRGQAQIPRPLAVRILREFLPQAREGEPEEEGLTPREREVLELVAQGCSNREIARRLYITETTVKNHLTRILQKLHLENRTQAAAYAHRRGWVWGRGKDLSGRV